MPIDTLAAAAMIMPLRRHCLSSFAMMLMDAELSRLLSADDVDSLPPLFAFITPLR